MEQYARSLLPKLEAILSRSDLTTISAKAVRKELVAKGEDEATVKEHRKDVDALVRIRAVIELMQISDIYDRLAGEDVAATDAPPREQPPFPQSSLPEPLRVQQVKSEVKEEKRFASSSRAAAETDEEMARRMQLEYDTLNRSRASRSAAAPRLKKKKVVKRKNLDDGHNDNEKPKKKRAGGGGGAFNKELVLSDALAELVGEPRLSRPQTVKRIWDYVKERDLQDQGDKRFILCDENLNKVFHTDRLHMFTMNKLLAAHFRDPDDLLIKVERGHDRKAEIDLEDED